MTGVLSGLVIARLRDSASIATVGILIIIHSTLVGAEDFTRGSQTFYGVKRFTSVPVAASVAIIALVIARWFRDSKTGIHVRASRDDAIAASSSGVRIQQSQFKAWVLSAAVAGGMGSCYAGLLGAFSPKDFYFTLTLTLLTMLIVGGSGSVAGAVVGVILVMAVIENLRKIGDSIGLFGLTNAGLAIIILLTLYLRPKGVMGFHEPEETAAYRGDSPILGEAVQLADALPSGEQGLVATNITKRFSGLVALDDASMFVERGKISGLIGPNGAGKTTLFNALCGLVTPDSGELHLNGKKHDFPKPFELVDLGIARTLQGVGLFGDLTVLENVMIGAQHLATTGLISAALGRNRKDENQIRDRARVALERVYAGGIAHRRADTLSYPDTKRVAIARALVSEPTILMLDEPAGGLGSQDIEWMNSLIKNLSNDMSVLLIEHHMDVVMSVCDRLYVLNFGELISSGEVETVRRDPAVVAAYLGVNN